MSSESREVVRVVLVDDHAMVRQAFSALLQEDARFDVVGEAEDRTTAVELVAARAPDVVVLDHDLPDTSGLVVIEDLDLRGVRPRFLVLTLHGGIHYAVRALEAGASGYLIKSAAFEDLKEAVLAVHRGRIHLPSEVADEVIDRLRRPRRSRIGLEALSGRELELLRALGQGLGVKEAAAVLCVSVSTASTYRARMLEKLGLGHTSQLIRFAVENGVV